MKTYTITIAPDDGDGPSAVIQVEIAGSTPRLTNISIVAGPNQSLSAADVGAAHADLPLSALMPAFSGLPGGGRPATTGAVASHGPGKESDNGKATAMRHRAGVRVGDRPRRYMPDDFVETYNRSATVAAVAEHYNVPAHTAQAWVKTARRHGLIAPARSRR